MILLRTFLVCLVILLTSGVVQSQESETADEVVDQESVASDVNLTWLAPVVTDEMTKDPEQNRQWRLGQYKYSSRPKDMWELGLHLGHFFIDGDVDRKIPGGFGLGLSLRKSLNYITSIRFEGFYGQASGLETQPWRHKSFGGGLVEFNDQFNGWEAYNGDQADGWFPSHKTTYYYGSVELVFNIGNILFHNERNKWNTYVALGVGLDHHSTMLDLLDANGNPYADLIQNTGFSRAVFNTKAGRDAIKNVLESTYDGNYETEGFKKEGIFRLGDDFNIHAIFTGSLGFSRKLSRRLNIGLEHEVILSDNDYLDGVKFRTAKDQSNNLDIGHYTSLRFGFNMGKFSKRTEPLYWLNPMENVFNEIAELKARPQFEWSDEDNDGVLDLVDQELDTPDGCLVDTKGVTLDSDGDGVVDCQDKEPFSPPGYPVDQFGVAQIDEPVILTEDDVITIIENNCDLCANKGIAMVPGGIQGGNYSGPTEVVDPNTGEVISNVRSQTVPPGTISPPGTTVNAYGQVVNTGCGNWFLPMIHFDLDKYAIRPESYPKLHQIATVMKMCPDICVTAHGHTDVRNSNSYNRVLSYNRAKMAIDYLVSNYGIDRERFNLMFGGEDSPLIQHLPDHHYTTEEEEIMQLMNRRVEFRLCEVTDLNLGRPEGREAGVGSFGSSRPGSKYSKGHKNTRY